MGPCGVGFSLGRIRYNLTLSTSELFFQGMQNTNRQKSVFVVICIPLDIRTRHPLITAEDWLAGMRLKEKACHASLATVH